MKTKLELLIDKEMGVDKKILKHEIILSVSIILSVLLAIFSGYLIGLNKSVDGNLIGVVKDGNVIYMSSQENYYKFQFENNSRGIILKFANPCVRVHTGKGVSMKPYWDNNTISIIDTCFPNERLEVGDIISFWKDDYEKAIHHRIIDIDYEKKWVQTQGDNPKTNTRPDDFTSFDKIRGKEIGVLNILEDKKNE